MKLYTQEDVADILNIARNHINNSVRNHPDYPSIENNLIVRDTLSFLSDFIHTLQRDHFQEKESTLKPFAEYKPPYK